ncbi:MAG: hypothetical protein HY360_27230 [Verrucomicrobia bacterium]|nr:hypothetical protein [Verrucomicrobiota bacterium]
MKIAQATVAIKPSPAALACYDLVIAPNVECMSLAQDSSNRKLVHLVNLRPKPQRRCRVEIHPSVKTRAVEVLFPPTDAAPQ